ncbi:Uncharacterised protein [Bordetella pertussis]|nr:Uncharacterised protein [Bordetella pertussis]
MVFVLGVSMIEFYLYVGWGDSGLTQNGFTRQAAQRAGMAQPATGG